jgi:alkanesulfonate monooxygenase SsuD/methylene tetrahydromethanopterin reductase-like flavin-dependent oxidoreductase (luciferase family)
MVATLDVASGGRVELGLGAGWYQAETAVYGLELPPVRERLDRLAEACRPTTAGWSVASKFRMPDFSKPSGSSNGIGPRWTLATAVASTS